jgi:hypothetical protein
VYDRRGEENRLKEQLTISNLTLLTKGDVVRNLLTAVNIFPSNVAALPASRPCEHPGPMSAPSPGLGNNSRQSSGPRSLFFSSPRGPAWLCSSPVLRRTLNNRAQHVSASEPATNWPKSTSESLGHPTRVLSFSLLSVLVS